MTRRGFSVGDRIIKPATDTHPDWCAAYGRMGTFRFLGASAIGKMHLRNARPRDDAFAVHSAGTWLAVAVSDGVGSSQRSRYGASFVVESLCQNLLSQITQLAIPNGNDSSKILAEAGQKDQQQQNEPELRGKNVEDECNYPEHNQRGNADDSWLNFEFPTSIEPLDQALTSFGTATWYHQPTLNVQQATPTTSDKQEELICTSEEQEVASQRIDLEKLVRLAFLYTRLGLEGFTESRKMLLNNLPCTLLGLLLNTKTGEVAVGQIGDGLIAWRSSNMGAHPLVEAPAPGETGETYVFTQSDWQEYLRIRILSSQATKDFSTYYLMTDGVAEDCIYPPPDDIFQRWARDIDREVRKEEPLSQTATRLLRWLANYEKPDSWDDRTLVVVLRDE